jgi:hypothetical protein
VTKKVTVTETVKYGKHGSKEVVTVKKVETRAPAWNRYPERRGIAYQAPDHGNRDWQQRGIYDR